MLDLNLNLNLGLASVFGDPTALTQNNADALFTALGLTQAGTGTTWGETGNDETPLYPVDAAKVPLAVEEINGKNYFGPIVNPAGTNLALYNKDATNAAWAKTNCTVELQTGSLNDANEANGHTLITATADNATAVTSITSTSGDRVTKWWVQTEDEDVFVSQGDVTGSSNIVVNGTFDSGANWTLDADGRSVISAGVLTYTPTGATVTDIDRNTGTDLVAGITYLIEFDVAANTLSGAAQQLRIKCSGSSSDFTSSINIAASAIGTDSQSVYFTPTTSGKLELRWFVDASTTGSISIDNLSAKAVNETELTPGSNPVPVDLAAYTGANPQLGIRIANSGDSVRLYGVQHQVAARPLRPYIGPTTSSTVTTGARTLSRTLGVAPTEMNFDILVRAPSILLGGERYAIFLGNDFTNVVALRFASDGSIKIMHRVLSSNYDANLVGAFTPNQIYLINFDIGPSGYSVTLDNDSPVTNANAMASGETKLSLAHDGTDIGQLGSTILAFRDNIGNLLDGNRGWNHRLLDNWA